MEHEQNQQNQQNQNTSDIEYEIVKQEKLLRILRGKAFEVSVWVTAYVGLLCASIIFTGVWVSVLFWMAGMQDGELKFEFLKYGFWAGLFVNNAVVVRLNWYEIVDKIMEWFD